MTGTIEKQNQHVSLSSLRPIQEFEETLQKQDRKLFDPKAASSRQGSMSQNKAHRTCLYAS